ncbi:hypothetical protein GUITHDRAFT_109878 [Guillardia theta CCMP2712]|uniref:Nucleotide exchange factor Fes1 domain-containing protein n=1 Tax=Guillardia theta (strain CCMP2712) TaxID=905079 RepID=L1J7N3_GUITC|nr:hypothetical protein GUITHDRAFT_109878 [Guillardia theta CCMP2712]EKX44095.1 hypothetical protein GUITHDRAFT_109878 [Guillardia theta CCMP2712]|eukprot:XP_005831075.1 hypothetical protein GUITHDRAFT_109878 [Guillardia theta CCMP2712]
MATRSSTCPRGSSASPASPPARLQLRLVAALLLLHAILVPTGSLKAQSEDQQKLLVNVEPMDQQDDILKYSSSTGLDYTEKISLDIENDPPLGLKNMIKFLKNGDERIIKTRLTRAARGKQHMFVRKGTSLIQSITSLLKHSDVQVRRSAAEAIHLLSLDNPAISEMIGLQSWAPEGCGMKELLDMISRSSAANASQDELAAGEQAAKTVWTLITNSRDNLESAHHHNAVKTISYVLMGTCTPLLKMWSAACLQKLVLDVYNSFDGSYTSSARKVQDNAKNQSEIACQQLQRPSEEVNQDLSQRVCAWAAVGAVGSLAISEENQQPILSVGFKQLLCKIQQSSCDLEKREATRSLEILDETCTEQESEELEEENQVKAEGIADSNDPKEL